MEVTRGKRRHRILVVNDNAATRRRIVALLNSHYETIEADGRSSHTLPTTIGRTPPDLVLVDISDTASSCKEICHALKAGALTQSIPVVFHFGIVGLDERLNGGEGDEISVKPLRSGNLQAWIARILRDTEGNRHRLAAGIAIGTLAEPVSFADLGAIKHGIEAIRASHDYAALCGALLAVCAKFDLMAAVRIRGRYGVLTRDGQGQPSAYDVALLDKLSRVDGIVDFYSCVVLNCEHATLMLTDMPRDNYGRQNRLFDQLALLVHYANDRARELENAASFIVNRDPAAKLPSLSPAAVA